VEEAAESVMSADVRLRDEVGTGDRVGQRQDAGDDVLQATGRVLNGTPPAAAHGFTGQIPDGPLQRPESRDHTQSAPPGAGVKTRPYGRVLTPTPHWRMPTPTPGDPEKADTTPRPRKT
jgi:hypothetical protein